MTEPQHMQALKQANEIRKKRSEMKAEIHSLEPHEGRGLVAALLENPPAELKGLAVFEFLRWPKFMGGRGLLGESFMHAARVPTDRTIGQLTVRQRLALSACLRGQAAYVEDQADLREFLQGRGAA